MAGRYNKAPIVYMAAVIKTLEIPPFLEEQKTLFQQLMMKHGLPIPVEGNLYHLQFEDVRGSEPTTTKQEIKRYGYFSQDRTKALIIGGGVIEWRTTQYTKFIDVLQELKPILNTLLENIDFFESLYAEEIVLNYADLIVPYGNRSLADYFQKGEAALPNTVFTTHENDLRRIGTVKIERIVNDTTRILASLEQMPVVDKKLPIQMPQVFAELDVKFSQPLFARHDEDITSSDYALLGTQAAAICKKKLGKFDLQKDFYNLHELTSKTFKDLINEEVCNKDWDYQKD